jgi:MtN3 and saliva related transmembrane protein
MDWTTAIGGLAGLLTTSSHVPQLKKCWQTRSAGDLSLRGLLVMVTGLAGWLGYGVLRSDWAIVATNGVSLALMLGILSIKLRESKH